MSNQPTKKTNNLGQLFSMLSPKYRKWVLVALTVILSVLALVGFGCNNPTLMQLVMDTSQMEQLCQITEDVVEPLEEIQEELELVPTLVPTP